MIKKRLIDANALPYENQVLSYDDEWCLKVSDIENAPTVDAVEVVRGRWDELPSMAPEYKCSECGQSYEWWEVSEAHYYPNCGAKMDGDG